MENNVNDLWSGLEGNTQRRKTEPKMALSSEV